MYMNIDKDYTIGQDGNIHLKNPVPFNYDVTYVEERYDEYKWQTTAMSYLRLNFIRNFMDIKEASVLDVGYGNGEFLEVCMMNKMYAYGYDVSGYPLPRGVQKLDRLHSGHYDLITFFDSLEHFEDIEFVGKLDAKNICISAPWCHHPGDANYEWFLNWKHLRPEEHFHHFTRLGLIAFMKRMGYKMLDYDNVEDHIRGGGKFGLPNILTAFFTREKK